MSNSTRRSDLGLGITAAGGNSGSFAQFQRSVFAPPPPLDIEPEPLAVVQNEWNEYPRDLLPSEPPSGISEDDWGSYITWRKRQRSDHLPEKVTAIEESAAPAPHSRAPYGLRTAWDNRAQASLEKLNSMVGAVPSQDFAWTRTRDELIHASAKAANPHATGIRILSKNGEPFEAELVGVSRDPMFRATPAELNLSKRIRRALGAAGTVGLFWTESEQGTEAFVPLP